MAELDPDSCAFAMKVIRREALFRRLMAVGIIIGLALLGLALHRASTGQTWAPTAVIAILVLLNARGNLRQAKVARILAAWAPRALLEPEAGHDG